MNDRLPVMGWEDAATLQRPLVACLAFVALYIVGAAIGQVLMLSPTLGTAVWPPSGIFVAALLRMPKVSWPTLVAVAVAIDGVASVAMWGFPPSVAAAVAAGNTLEALCGAWLLSRGQRWFTVEDESTVLRLVGLSAFGSTLLSTFIGGTAVALHLGLPLLSAWGLWWSGDAIGVLMFAPPVLLLFKRGNAPAASRAPEVVAMAAATLAGGHLLLTSGYPVLFLLFPLVIWGAMRAEFAGVIVIGGLSVVQTLLYTRLGYGPFLRIPTDDLRQFLTQLFLMTLLITGLMLAGLFQRRRIALLRENDARQTAEAMVALRTAELDAREQELRQANERLRQADAAKDRFLAALAHEVRSPLMAIHTGLAVLRRDPSADVRDRVHGSIERQATLLTSLTDDLLDLARVREGKLHLDMQPVEIGVIVATAVEAARPEIERARHALSVEPAAREAVVRGDFTRLVQAVLNLLTNASRYTPEGGRITVEAVLAGDQVEVSITDNGMGIDPSEVPTLFDLYSQGSASQLGGLGIGLSLVRRIMDVHGGKVRVASDGRGHGSRFTLSLPVVAVVAPDPS